MKMDFQEWLRTNTNLMERTILNYVRSIDRFHDKYDELTVENINAFITDSTREKRSYYVKYAFRHYLKYLKKKSIYDDILKVRIKPVKKEGIYIKKHELLRMVLLIKNPKRRMVALMQYLTGLRAGDILRSSFDKGYVKILQEGRTMMIRMTLKGNKKHWAFIPGNYIPAVRKFIKENGFEKPFLQGESSSMRTLIDTNYRYYYDDIKEAAAKIGHPDFSTHDFRRNFVEDVFTKTKDIRKAQRLAGHSNVKDTMKYVSKYIDEDEMIDTVESVRGEEWE